MKTKTSTNKVSRTMDLLGKHHQHELAIRLGMIEINRLLLERKQERLNARIRKNRARWNDLAMDIDHFILINIEDD